MTKQPVVLAATLVAVLGLAGLQWSGVLSNGPEGEGKLEVDLAKTPTVLVATSPLKSGLL